MRRDSATLKDATCLTPREIDVLRLIARGCTYKQVADRLGVSLHTVASHTKNTYRKLGVRSSAAAVMQAVTMQLLGHSEENVLPTLKDGSSVEPNAGGRPAVRRRDHQFFIFPS